MSTEPATNGEPQNPLQQIEAFPEIPLPPGVETQEVTIPIEEIEALPDPPKKKGRPKGSKTKRKANVRPEEEPGEMFSGGPPEEPTAFTAPPEEEIAPTTTVKTKRKKLSPKAMAEKAERVLTGGFVFVVDKRYSGMVLTFPNPSNPAEILQAPAVALAIPTAPEREELIADLIDVFEDLQISLTPWQSFGLTVATVYGKRLLQIEMAAREQYNRDGSKKA